MNNIPQFLAHLPIWNDKPMDGVRGVPTRYGKQNEKIRRVCVSINTTLMIIKRPIW